MSTKTMKAARYYGKEDIRIKSDIPIPSCSSNQVLIEPAFVGICGTDLHEYLGGPNFSPSETPHPVTKEQIPITIGHEFSGTIKQIGENASRGGLLEVGQKVAVQPTIYCGHCGACRVGAENACPNGGFIGLSGGGGGMSQFVSVPCEAIFPLPPTIPLSIGALVEPLAVAWHAVDASPIASLTSPKCLVLGGGPIGLAVVQVLLGRGAHTVICAEVAKKRQEFAKEFGAHYVIDPSKVDVQSTCLEICGGVNGPDLVFDCAGVPKSLQSACETVRSRGTVVNVAIWEKEVPFNPNWLVFREASYKAVLGYQKKDFQGVVDALGSGDLKPERMITSTIKWDKLVDEGYLALINEKDKHVKILVDVQASLHC